MRSGLWPLPVVATVLLHAAVIAAIVAHFSASKDKTAEPAVISVELIPPPAPPQPQAPPSASTIPPVPAPAPPALPVPKKSSAPKPAARPRAQDRPRATRPAAEAKAPDKPSAPRPAAPDTTPIQPSSRATPADASPPSTPPASPAAPAAPARTAASEASYAATNRKPPYPALSRRYGEQGTVVLRVLVNPDGTAGAVELKASSGYPLLDESARTTVQAWRFNPATSDGRPVAEWYQVSIPFKLQD